MDYNTLRSIGFFTSGVCMLLSLFIDSVLTFGFFVLFTIFLLLGGKK